MKVYVVRDTEDYQIVGIFSSEEKAEEYKAGDPWLETVDYEVDELDGQESVG